MDKWKIKQKIHRENTTNDRGDETCLSLQGGLLGSVNLSIFHHLYYLYCFFYEFFCLAFSFIHVSLSIIIIDLRKFSAFSSSHPSLMHGISYRIAYLYLTYWTILSIRLLISKLYNPCFKLEFCMKLIVWSTITQYGYFEL